jgi:polar amino acid transport system substrate-binding protein
MIATRHNQHASLTIEALKAGKAVFVEKPLAMTPESLSEVCALTETNPHPRLLVGYNRRFSPLARQCKEFFATCAEPLFILYRVNAGSFPPETWVFDPVEGGGRIIGEMCHFVDMLCYLTGSHPSRIFAEEVDSSPHPAHNRDSVIVNLRMSNGSVGVIHYMANGASCVSKEYMEVYGGQRTAILDNYKSLSLCRGNKRRSQRLFNQAKGHAEEVIEFVKAIETGDRMPINFETLVAVTQTTFLIHRSLDLGVPIDYVSPLVEAKPS